MPQPEFFGNESQQSMMQKSSSLWQLIKSDKRFQCHGRAIGLNAVESQDINVHVALAKLLGASGINDLPAEAGDKYIQELEDRGFKTDRYESWGGGSDALIASREILKDNHLAEDLTMVSIDKNSPPQSLRTLAELTQSCGVLLPMGGFMRGVERPSVCLYVQDKQGRAVGCSSAVAAFHSDSQNANQAWWGMLATHTERRGERIALQLGAHSMLAMNKQHGFSNFVTGIRRGNTASEKLCTRLGLRLTGHCVIIAIDPSRFAGAQMTK